MVYFIGKGEWEEEDGNGEGAGVIDKGIRQVFG